uniref:Putative ubiquitin-activating enzyme e1 n=1 Tax=Trypanosoma congolense (strain IL3000) TaxID=1068625 RepID=G0ULY0_TRYCI|nr:putative ubiquitin-activating enzyme e1 [Trypanosoma congolense IL3000]
MYVQVGHVVFPPELLSSRGETIGSAKRVKCEGSLGASLHSAEAISLAVSMGVQRILKGLGDGADVSDVFVDVKVDEERRGASFCFVRHFLSIAAAAPVGAPVPLPADFPLEGFERSIYSFDEIELQSPDGAYAMRLPVFREKRPVIIMPTSDSGGVERQAAGIGTDTQHPAAAGDETLLEKRVLVVGAGGIGCELLKVLVLYGFNNIDMFDLDTIDATNLNRQFLFCKNDVGESKSVTARKAILSWFSPPSHRQVPTIRAYHANIKDEMYDESFFSQFSIVLNALDNIGARQHVNRMCMRAGVPLIDSGTMGYNGQVQPIVYGRYECYDCHPKAANQQTVAVCTVHARPTTMVHCVHYAKELYERLFGDGQREGGDELAFVDDLLNQEGGCKDSVTKPDKGGLLKMAVALGRCLFIEKIEELLSMKSTWPTKPPLPIGNDVIDRVVDHFPQLMGSSTGDTLNVNRDNVMSVDEAISLFLDSFVRCALRSERCAFRKEDDDTIDFVAAVSNIRATMFHIFPQQSVEEIRTVAGKIVPAVATTNAIVAAGVVQQALRVLSLTNATHPVMEPKMIYVRKVPQERRRRLPLDPPGTVLEAGDGCARKMQNVSDLYLVHSAPPNPCNAKCIVCRNRHPTVQVYLDAQNITVGGFVRRVLSERLKMHEPSLFQGLNVLYEEGEYEALASTPLINLMKAIHSKPLDLLVDDLNHKVEWRVVVFHSDGCGQQSTDDGIVMEGLEAALALERALLEEVSTADEGDRPEESHPAESESPAKGNPTGACAVVFVHSDDDDENGDVVEIE